MRASKQRLLICALLVALVAGAAGASLVHFRHPLYLVALSLWRGEAIPAKADETVLQTTLLRLDVTIDDVVEPGHFNGGGLTGHDDGAFLITGQGSLYFIRGPGDVTALTLAPPDAGRDAASDYVKMRPGIDLDPTRLRYNHLHVVPTPEGQRLWVSFTRFEPGANCVRNVIAELSEPLPAAEDLHAGSLAGRWSDVFQSEPCLPMRTTGRAIEGHMAGGRMALGSDGLVYVTVGNLGFSDDGSATALSQDPQTDYGKILAIDPGTPTVAVISQGHRNAQGIAFDAMGRLWSTEHAQRGGDELNLILPGGDYGYPQNSLGTAYDLAPVPGSQGFGRHDQFEPPRFAWLPSIAPSSLSLVSDFDGAWDGDLLMGTLRGRSLVRLRIEEDRVLYSERIELGVRVRYAMVLGGYILIWSDNSTLIWLAPAPLHDGAERRLTAALDAVADPTDREWLSGALSGCLECHGLTDLDGGQTPPLAALNGRAASDGEPWNAERLGRFIVDPAGVIPTTRMAAPGHDAPERARLLASFLLDLAAE